MNEKILPLVALLAAAGIFFFYVSPTWSGPIAETKAAIALDDKALAAAEDYTKQQNTLASARNAIDPENLARLTKFLPDSVDNVGTILNLNALAARSGLSFANIDVVADVPSGEVMSLQSALPSSGVSPIGSVDLTVAAVGTYASLQSFLVGVERSARLLHIQDLIVKGSETGVYNYQMKLRLFWLR